MSLPRPLVTATALAAVLMLSACAGGFPSIGGAKEKKEAATAEERAGRITMVLTEDKIEANAELASTTIELPPAAPLASWEQAGANAAKVVGHVGGGAALEIAWRTSVGSGSDKKAALTTPPVASATTVYTLDSAQRVQATDITNGKSQWSKKLQGLSKRDKIALGGGLAVSGDTLIVASGFGYVTALNAATGEEQWKRVMNGPITGAPTIKDGRIFVASNNNEVFALDLATGETEWSDQAISETARVLGSSSVAAVEDFVIAPYSSGEIIAYLASNGRRLWTDAISQSGRFTPISQINDIGSRPVLAGGLVFASAQSGVTIAIDGRSGNRVWTQPIGSANAPAIVGGTMFVVGTGQFAALNAGNGEAYWVTELQQFEKEEKKKERISYSGPILASDQVFLVSSVGQLLAFSPQTGQQTGSVKLGDPTYLEPISVGDKLIILTDDAKLIAIR